MRILVSPNAFKGTMSPVEAARAIAAGFRRHAPDATVTERAIADGGDGLIEVIAAATPGTLASEAVTDPLGRTIEASYLIDGSSAVIEMARASGLVLLRPDERDPRRTSSSGTGDLIRSALDRGARDIMLGLGGSATNDGGLGAARALGVIFRDADGTAITRADELTRLHAIDMTQRDARLNACAIRIACDVQTPLLGPTGATTTFGPQKGARPDDLIVLEAGLQRLADCVADQFGIEIASIPGGGAAGGLGAGAHALLGASLHSGSDLVLDAIGFDQAAARADLVVTGEGRFDAQTLTGKAPYVALRRADPTPGAIIAGSISVADDTLRDLGVVATATLDTDSIDEAVRLILDQLA